MSPFSLSPLLILIFVLEELSSAIIKVEFQLPLFFPFFHLLIIKKSSVLKLSVRDLIPKVILCKRVKPKLVQLFFLVIQTLKITLFHTASIDSLIIYLKANFS